MRCPGQDRRYWTEDAVFEVPCPECGRSVELFKDETSGRCAHCGHRFPNPGMDFGCAQWCALAEQCLGLVPQRDADADASEGALAGRLIQKLGEFLASDAARLARSLKTFHHAKQLVPGHDANPRVVLAASLLLGLCENTLANGAATAGSQRAREMLQEIGFDEPAAARVCEILDCHQAGRRLACLEFQIVHDAHTLNTLATQILAADPSELAQAIETQLMTDAAKQWARKWTKGLRMKDEGQNTHERT